MSVTQLSADRSLSALKTAYRAAGIDVECLDFDIFEPSDTCADEAGAYTGLAVYAQAWRDGVTCDVLPPPSAVAQIAAALATSEPRLGRLTRHLN